jgi:hypothetical protein
VDELDLRANRTFNRPSSRITLFVEVMNVFNRENGRFTPPGVNGRTGQAFGLFELMIRSCPRRECWWSSDGLPLARIDKARYDPASNTRFG